MRRDRIGDWNMKLSAFAAVAAAAGLAPAAHAQAAAIEWRPHVHKLRSGESVEAQVGALIVPLRRDKPGAGSLTLRFVRLPATKPTSAPPIVYLAGGPGGSGVEAAKGERWPLFETLRRDGDVILLDQRGVGLSDPPPSCGQPLQVPTDRVLTEAGLNAAIATGLANCAAEWRAKGVDLDAYDTAENAADVADLARALGGKVRLVTISYGTFLAFAVLRDHAAIVDRVVLAGTEGPEHTTKLPLQADRALALLSRHAAADPAASKMTPDLERSLRAVLERLEKAPVWAEAKGPDGQLQRILIGKYDVQLVAAFMLATTPNASRLPGLVAAMEQGQPGPMANVALMLRRFLGSASAMTLAMDAASPVSPARERQVAAEAKRSLFGNAVNFPSADLATPLGIKVLPARFRTPLRTEVPALFISGDLDSRTPPANAEAVRKGFRTSGHLVLEGAGHDNDLFLSSPVILERIDGFLRGEPPRDETVKVQALKFD